MNFVRDEWSVEVKVLNVGEPVSLPAVHKVPRYLKRRDGFIAVTDSGAILVW